MSLNLWAYALKSHMHGQIDEGEWFAWNNWFVGEMSNPAWVEVYEDMRDGYHPDFRTHVDASLPRR